MGSIHGELVNFVESRVRFPGIFRVWKTEPMYEEFEVAKSLGVLEISVRDDEFHGVLLVVARGVEGELGWRVTSFRIELMKFANVIGVLAVGDDVDADVVIVILYFCNSVRTAKFCR